jgi:hypothetical protein
LTLLKTIFVVPQIGNDHVTSRLIESSRRAAKCKTKRFPSPAAAGFPSPAAAAVRASVPPQHAEESYGHFPTSGIISWKDFQVGNTITMYGRTFNISNCDAFTKEFYDSNGCPQQDSAMGPDDAYTIKRAEFKKPSQKVSRAIDWNLRKKLNNPFSKKCLRFIAFRDDRASQFGEKRPYVYCSCTIDDFTFTNTISTFSPSSDRQVLLGG